MAVQSEGAPCWADAIFGDVEGAKSFYGDVLGWTFGETLPEYGNYTQAYVDGKAVAAIMPTVPGRETPSQWCLYLASPDAAATAGRVRENGGEVLIEPMRVGEFGTMSVARDPSGAVFGIWQGGSHRGFEAVATPGAYCWAEVYTREAAKADAFFTGVFPYTSAQVDAGGMDFRIYRIDGTAVMGRMAMTDDFPAEVPAHVNVYFTVADCDEAVAAATKGGGVLRFGPMDSPFGRFATLTDPQGAVFTVIDVTTTQGEMPDLTDAP